MKMKYTHTVQEKRFPALQAIAAALLCLVLLCCSFVQTTIAESGDPGHSGTSSFNEADGNKIESIHLVWNTEDTRDNGEIDNLWLSSSSTTPLSMKFTLQVNLSGQADAGDYAPGSLRIRIPRQIWHKRDTAGEPGSMLDGLYGKLDVPVTITPNPNVDWYYEIDGDYCVFVNNKKIGATSNHSFECTIYDINPLMIVDESISENLQAHIDAVTSLGSTIWMDSNTLVAQIDTSERISGATKSAKLYEFIDDDDGVPQAVLDRLPEGTSPEEYVYVRWTTRSTMTGNQYFSLAMDDPETWCFDRVLNHETGEEQYIPECQGIFLAETDNGNVLVGLGDEPQPGKGEIYNDGKSYKNDYVAVNTYSQNSRTITLWAAYPNATFQDGHTYYFRNKDDWDLLEYDPEVEYWEGTDHQVLTEAAASNSVNFTKMKWVYPPGRFLAFKYIETNRTHKHPYYDSSNGSHKKVHTYEMALNRLRDGQDITMEYELLTVGYGYMFTAGPLANVVEWEDNNGAKHSAQINEQYNDNWDSEEWIQDPERFCNWYYVMDTSDRWDFFNYVDRAGGDPQLTGEDYQFDGVYIQAPEIFDYARQKNSQYRFKQDTPFGYYPSSDPEKIPTVELWVEYDNSARIDRESDSGNPEGWTYMGEYEVKNGCIWVPFDNTTDAGIITGIRTRVTTNEAACKLTVYPHITLKATDRVRSIVEQLFVESGTPSTTFRNDDNLYIELFKTAEDQSIYDEQTNPEGKVHPNQQMFLDEDVYFRQDIWDDSAMAKFTGAGYGITLNKNVRFDSRSIEAGGDNDIINKRAILHYTATCTQESNLTSLSLYNEAVESGAVKQDYSCVWYDLLPEKVQPIVDTVRMTRPGDKVLRVTTIPNYKDTGRIMMIVECQLEPRPERVRTGGPYGDKITLAFDSYITWLDLNSMPDNFEFMNYVAYESGIEGQVGTIKGKQGEKDTILPTPRLNTSTPGSVPEKIVQAFTDLDPDTDDGRFVYARASVTPRVNMDAHTEYVKYVSNDLDGIWTQGLDGQHQVNVYEGHNYTYRLTVASAKGTNTWDMVFYDSIENYLIPRPDPDDPMHDATKEADYLDTREKANWQGDWQEGNGGAPGGQWRGRLYQVDLSELYEMDCAPILYYSTIPWMQFSDTYGEVVDENVIFNDANGHYMLEDINTWTPVDMSTLVDGKWDVPEGLEVTAIAVDAKETKDGEKFILRSKESVSFYLRMTAPDDHGMEDQWHAKGAYARFRDDASTFEDIDWEAATNPENNMHAFNNTRLISRQAHEDDSTMRAFLTMIRNDYTRVGIMPVIKSVEKVWDDDDNHDNIRPDSITVEMLRKTQLSAGDYEPVIDANTGEPVTLTITPTVVEEEVDGEIVEKEVWKGIFYQVPVVDEQGNRYLYQFRDTVTGYTCASAEDAEGNIILTNTHKNETIPIKGEKQWLMPDGADLSDEAVALMPESIRVHLYRTGTSGEEELVTSITVTPDASGKWTYNFGQQEKYERGGSPYTYTIKEEPVTGFVSSLMDPSLLPEGYEVPFLGSSEYNPDVLTTFYNFYVPLGDLAVQKNILQATEVSAQKDFAFTLELTDPADPDAGVPGVFDYAVYTVLTDDETGEETLAEPAVRTGSLSSGGTFTLKGGQRIVIRKLPVGINYVVTEAESDGWNVASAPGETAGPVMENATGMVRSGETVQATFTNTYTASGYAQVLARKQLTGREMITSSFGFELVDNNVDSETYGQVILSAYNQTPGETVQDDNGVITSVAEVKFGSLAYTQADAGKTFHYQVREKNTGNPGYTYDDTVFDVAVAVTDNGNGTLTTVVSPADPAELLFENVYEAEGELSLRGWKQLQKRDAEDQEFTFELWQSNAQGEKLGSAPLQTVKNDADSNVLFAPIVFDQSMVSLDEENPFVYYYLMTEKDTGDDTILYSGYQHLFIVTPQDNGNGTISFDQQDRGFNADGSEAASSVPVFINDVENGHLKLSKVVTNGNPATKFTFKVKLVGMEGGSFDLERSGGSTADGEEDQEEEPPATASGLKPVYYAPAEEMNGRSAFAALNKTTGELVLFRADPNAPMDPWGNTFTNSGFSSNRKVSADGNFVWYNGLENSSDVHPWTNTSDRSYVRTVTMRDPIRPYSLKYYFQNCSNLVSVSLDKMDLHNASGSVRSIALWSTFENTPNIKEIDLGSLDLSSTSDLDKAFQYCYSLETLNIGHMNRSGSALSSTSYRRYAFQGTKITRITIGDKTNFGSDISVGTWYHYPTPPAGYQDLWINVDTNEQLTSLQLFTEGGHGGTWELDPKEYTITFDANGGTGAMASKTINVRREFVTGYNFYKFGYDFVGFRDNYGTLYPVNDAGKVTIPSNAYTNKIVAGEELQVTLYAEWAEVDNSANATGDTLTVTLYGGESVTIKNLPAYTAYEVWEELPTGWRLVSKVNDSGEIQPLETTECTFTNKYAPNEATVNLNAYKLMDGERAGGYTFALYEADSNWQPVGEPIDTKVSSAGGIASFDVLSYGPEDTGDHRYVIAEVVENPDPDIAYDTDLEQVTVTVSDDGAGNMSAVAGYHVDGGTFRNNTKPGSLKLTKNIVNPTGVSVYQEFRFRITFFDRQGNPAVLKQAGVELTGLRGTITAAGSTSGRNITYTVTNGAITVSLYGGETLSLTDVIPAGVTYKIEELELPPAWELTEATGETGSILSSQTSEAVFTNTYNAKGTIPLAVEKQLEGETPEAGAFTFEMYTIMKNDVDLNVWDYANGRPLDGQQPLQTAANTQTDDRETLQVFISEEDGMGTLPNPEYQSSMAVFQPVEVTEEGIYMFAIREVPGDDSTMIYDDRAIYAQARIRDCFGDGRLITDSVVYFRYEPGTDTYEYLGIYGYLDLSITPPVPVLFTNNYQAMLYAMQYTNPVYTPMPDTADTARAFRNARRDGELAVTKQVTGATAAADGTEFTITVSLTDKNGQLLANRTYPTAVDGTAGQPMTTDANGIGTVTIQDGQTLVISGLPHGAAYVVSETDLPGGFALEGIDGAQGTIVGAEQSQTTVHNSYSAVGSLNLVATKVMTPAEFLTLDEGRFTFEVKDDRGSVIRSAVNTADGQVVFDPINYTMDDLDTTFIYTITEAGTDNLVEIGQESPYATDLTVYAVEVTLSDNGDGTLQVNPRILLEDEEITTVLFSNTEKTKVEVTKTWAGDEEHPEMRPSYIILTLYADGEMLYSRAVNGERNGTDDPDVWAYTFNNLPKYQNGQLITYTVAEETVDGYYPTIEGEDNSFAIRNTYSDTEISLAGTKTFTDHLTGEATELTDGQFRVRIEGKQGTEPLPQQPVVDVLADSSFDFGTIPLTLNALGVDADGHYNLSNTLIYRISEVIPEGVTEDSIDGQTHIRYDATVYEITVDLAYDPATGELTAQVDPLAENIAFANESSADLCVLTLTAEKQQENRDPQDGEYTFCLELDGAQIATATNDAEGLVTFPEITYSAADLADAPVVDGIRTKTLLYTMYEVDGGITGISYDDHVETITVILTENEEGSLTVSADKIGDAQPVFVNTLETTQITVTKEWVHMQPAPITLTVGSVQNDAFVALDPQPAARQEGLTYTFTDLPKYDPAGVEILYAVMEGTQPAHILQSYANEGGEERFALDGGTIINTYTAQGSILFSGTKTLEGRALAEGEFSFTLYGSDGEAIETARNGADGTFEFSALNYLYNAETSDLGEHTYTVKEDVGELGGVTYDETEYTLTVTVADNGDGTLAVTAGDNAAALDFVNRYEATGEVAFSGTKTLEGRALAEGEFSFTLYGSEGEVIETVSNDADGTFAFSALHYLHNAETSDLGEHTYTVKEDVGELGGVTYDETEYTLTVTVADNGDGTLAVTASDNAAALDFVNRYEAAGEIAFSGTKTLEGRALAEGEFSFTLYSSEGEVIETVSNDADGAFAFSALHYLHNAETSDLGEHTYTVKEDVGELGGVTYDETEYTLTVTVADNGDGTLAVTAGDNAAALDFVNRYEAAGEIAFSGTKTLEGRALAEGEFSFTLYGSEGEVIETVSNDADGAFAFSALHYLHNAETSDLGEHTYTVKEDVGELVGVTYDETEYTLTVTVADNGDGTLTAISAISNGSEAAEAIAFSNRYQAAAQWQPTATKTVNGAEPREDQVYEFTLIDEEGNTIRAENEKGSITFGTLLYDLTDAGKTFTYTVQETTPSSGALIADETVYTVKVAVSDNGDGTLKVEPAIFCNDAEAEAITFNNLLTGAFTVTKQVEGGDTEKAFSFTVKLYNADGSEATGTYPYTGASAGELASGDAILLSHGQSITVSGLMSGMTYTVTEADPVAYDTTVNGQPGITGEGIVEETTGEICFVNKLKTTTFRVTKEWRGGSGPIELTLYANGKKLAPQPAYSRDGDAYTYTSLPVYDDLNLPIEYSAKEKYVDGFLTIYMNVEPHTEKTKAIYNGGTILNKAYEKPDFSVKKEWRGLDGNETAPAIQLVLYCNGEAMDYDTPAPDRNGWYKYYDLPGEVNGETAVYTVKEAPAEGFDTAYTLAGGASADYADNGGTIINTKIPQTGDQTPLALLLTLLGASAVVLVLLLKRRRV